MINNAGGIENSTTNPGDASGLYVVNRTAANANAVYRNGAKLATYATGSIPPLNQNFVMHGGGLNPGNDWVRAVFFIGSGLTDADVTALYNRVRTYLQAIGAV